MYYSVGYNNGGHIKLLCTSTPDLKAKHSASRLHFQISRAQCAKNNKHEHGRPGCQGLIQHGSRRARAVTVSISQLQISDTKLGGTLDISAHFDA